MDNLLKLPKHRDWKKTQQIIIKEDNIKIYKTVHKSYNILYQGVQRF